MSYNGLIDVASLSIGPMLVHKSMHIIIIFFQIHTEVVLLKPKLVIMAFSPAFIFLFAAMVVVAQGQCKSIITINS